MTDSIMYLLENISVSLRSFKMMLSKICTRHLRSFKTDSCKQVVSAPCQSKRKIVSSRIAKSMSWVRNQVAKEQRSRWCSWHLWKDIRWAQGRRITGQWCFTCRALAELNTCWMAHLLSDVWPILCPVTALVTETWPAFSSASEKRELSLLAYPVTS